MYAHKLQSIKNVCMCVCVCAVCMLQ
jgi:hypothetical protein